MGAANFCSFRGMLMKSAIHMKGRTGMRLFGSAKARLVIGDHPRAAPLKTLEIGAKPIATAYIPGAVGTLDDHVECWFLHDAAPPQAAPEGMESVIELPLDETWPPPPTAPLQGLVIDNL